MRSHYTGMKKNAGKQRAKRRVGRPLKSEVGSNEVRGKILEAAEYVFSEKGIHAAGLREIAKRSKHSLAIVTYYFKTKENLILAVLDRHSEDHRKALSLVLAKHQGPLTLQRLGEFLRAEMEWYGTQPGLRSYRIQQSTKLDLSRKIAAHMRDFWTESTERLAEMIREVNPTLDDLDAKQRGLMLLMLLQVRCELSLTDGPVVQGYEQWFLKKILPMLVEEDAPK